jgi:hypothetical protein
MTTTTTTAGTGRTGFRAFVNFHHLWWVGGAFAVMFAAMASDSLWALNFVHVMAGVLWTGIDLFMGFVIGPIQRKLDLAARRQLVMRLMPVMLFLMPTLATITGWAGTTLASRLGFYDLPYPEKLWVIGALTVLAILTVQGFAILLPTSIRVCIEIAKDEPDLTMVSNRMRRYVYYTGFQGLMQVAMIVIMARFATGM